MNIGIDARIMQGPLRGQGQYVYYLSKYLPAIEPRNTYVLFYNGVRKFSRPLSADAGLKHCWSRIPGTLLRPLWRYCNAPPVEALAGKLDLFHHTFNFNFTHYTPIPSRCPCVVTFNGMAEPSAIWRRYDAAAIERWFEIIARRARRIIAVSESVRDDLLRRVKYPEEKIRVIHYGVSERFSPRDDHRGTEAVLNKYGLAGKRYLLYVGAAEKNKNLDGLVRAFAQLMRGKKEQNLFLALAGNIDEAYRGIMKTAAEAGVGAQVVFPGYAGHDDLPYIYRGAELFVLASFNEWFGIPLLEAMACGVPVVASRCRGVPEVVGDAGILFDPHDTAALVSALEAVLGNVQLREELREKGLRRVREFSWEKTARKTLAVYQEACVL